MLFSFLKVKFGFWFLITYYTFFVYSALKATLFKIAAQH
jgi:hypothetical protein